MTGLQLTELVGAALIYRDAARDEVQLQPIGSAIDDVEAVFPRDIEHQAATACVWRGGLPH
jgi:hypothetical protein